MRSSAYAWAALAAAHAQELALLGALHAGETITGSQGIHQASWLYDANLPELWALASI